MKLSQPQQHDIRFGQEKFLRHPLKDGINLLMIGQELQRETKQLEPIKLFQEAMSETKIGDEAPDHFYLPKVLEYGSFCLTSEKVTAKEDNSLQSKFKNKKNKTLLILKGELTKVLDIENYI
jgi:hypothetical protein